MDYTYEDIAGSIDHSLLQPQLTDAELEGGCQVALRYGVASICAKPYFVRRAAEILAGSRVAVGTTIGFPHGGHLAVVKVFEAERALDDGATELDMVVNIGKVLGGDWDAVTGDIRGVVDAATRRGGLVKVIFENCYLSDPQKVRLCEACVEAGAHYVKTSTGYGSSGATLEDVRLMRRHTPAHIGVKAAGGVRDLDTLLAMRAIGVTRFGATRTADILEECRRRLGGEERR